MLTWGVAGTVWIPLQVFVHGFPACGLWHIYESCDICFFLSLWASLIYTPYGPHARIYITIHSVIAWYQRKAAEALLDSLVHGGEFVLGEKVKIFPWGANIFSFLSPELIWRAAVKWDRDTVGGVSAAVFDVKDLHLR